MIDSDGKLYIGRKWDLEKRETQAESLFYDPDDLTTHAVVVGMTGSGKTGLCIDILEEAALQGIPALMIDPKGDITNTLLHFPDLLPEDFAPWVNPDEVRRKDMTIEQAAEETADLWRSGLGDWGIHGDRIQALKESASFAIYTPGSDAGLSLSILASLEAPAIPWDDNRELLREQISSTVTALLGLIGFNDIDPITSREHVLLANIFENAWGRGKDLDLGELIMQIQTPPFDKVGFLQTEAFFPEKDRFSLAAKLNNLIASPSFRSWIEGDPLDIQTLLFDEESRPRHTVFYIAHLDDQERMFFVTLFFSAVETWMRTQSGTSTLRSLIYFDEIFGYLPPTSSPPSKEPMLRMLKQARAFGVGLLLATQNPVDIDYKALSNAGSWFIGRLSTARDKERLIDGLSGSSGGGFDKKTLSDAISSLGKRVFLLRNVHEKESELFQTRWAMNYMAGPMTRVQIPAINELAGAEPLSKQEKKKPGNAAAVTAAPAAAGEPVAVDFAAEGLPGTRTRPPAPRGIAELFLPVTLDYQEAAGMAGRALKPDAGPISLIYHPLLFGQATIHYSSRKYDLQHEKEVAFLVQDVSPRGNVDWEEFMIDPLDLDRLSQEPGGDVRFVALEKPFSDKAILTDAKTALVDWIYRKALVMVKVNKELGLFAGPAVDEETFQKRCDAAADERLQEDIDELEERHRRELEAIETKLKREKRELAEDQAEVARRKQAEYTSYAETLLSFFKGRRRSLSTAMGKRGRRSQAEEDVQESLDQIIELEEDIVELAAELEVEMNQLEEKWADIADNIEEIPVTPYKKDIDVEFFGIAWLPHYLVQTGRRQVEIPAYELDR